MFILTPKGEVQEGIQLTDADVKTREALLKVLHEKLCGRYNTHGSYQRRTSAEEVRCEIVANYLIAKFTLTAREGISLENEIAEALKSDDEEVVQAPPAA